ncbi:hypothetical protein [Mitsuaria sp. TWR114]|uniref:hypothetical protein n=1 Tax=Mitsuaria sp. TWR114 TaxID=2601731 RepID=UPI0038573F66
MLAAEHRHRPLLRQRRADRVRAAPALVPDRAGPQRHPLRPVDEAAIPQRAQQQALRVGQDDQAVAVARLLEEVFHHRPRVGNQLVLPLQRTPELGARRMRRARRTADRVQAEITLRSQLPAQAFVQRLDAEPTGVQQLAPRGAQQPRRQRGAARGFHHPVVSLRRRPRPRRSVRCSPSTRSRV